jgi:uncharacterized protein YciI
LRISEIKRTMTGYLPGDPRYGLSGEALRNYYRTKPAQWAIYCWDKPGTEATRRALLQPQKSYVKEFGERVIGYGHFVSDDGRDTLGTSFFMQLGDRATADAFVAGEPMNKAGVYQRVPCLGSARSAPHSITCSSLRSP